MIVQSRFARFQPWPLYPMATKVPNRAAYSSILHPHLVTGLSYLCLYYLIQFVGRRSGLVYHCFQSRLERLLVKKRQRQQWRTTTSCLMIWLWRFCYDCQLNVWSDSVVYARHGMLWLEILFSWPNTWIRLILLTMVMQASWFVTHENTPSPCFLMKH